MSLGSDGYIWIWRPAHPLANKNGCVLEHRLVVHDAGIEIPPGHNVHHLNGDKTDNRLENLEVKPVADHIRDHIQAAGQISNQYGTWPLKRHTRNADAML